MRATLALSFQVMVWCAFGYSGKLPLVVWPPHETVTAETYSTRVLGDVVQPWLDANDPHRRRWTLQEDGSPVHWARRSQEAKAEGGIVALARGEWPSASPDLAPNDYWLWSWMCKEVRFGSTFRF